MGAESLQTQLTRGELQAEEKMVDMLTFLMRMLTSMKENAVVMDSWGHWGELSPRLVLYEAFVGKIVAKFRRKLA